MSTDVVIPPNTQEDDSTDFQPVSPKYLWVKIIHATLWLLLGVVIAIGVGFFVPHWVSYTIGGVSLAGVIIRIIFAARQIKALGYQAREHDLLIKRGIMFQSTTVVPYGRMQFVDVSTGPILRIFGLATVELNTAAATTDATVPGLPQAEAHQLRELLAVRGASALSGL